VKRSASWPDRRRADIPVAGSASQSPYGGTSREAPDLQLHAGDGKRASPGRAVARSSLSTPVEAVTIRAPHSPRARYVVSTPHEMFRAVLPTITPDGEQATMIITRQGQGSDGRVWVTFSGVRVTTAVLTDEDAERLVRLVGAARTAMPVKALRWALSRRDERSHLLGDVGSGARCGHDIEVKTEAVLSIVPCTQCTTSLFHELLRTLEVSETEVREWLAL